jgi:hypothetical protein
MAHGFPEGFDSKSFVQMPMQGLFKNDFPGLMFQNFLGLDGNPIGPDISGRYVLEQIYGMTTRRGKWVSYVR